MTAPLDIRQKLLLYDAILASGSGLIPVTAIGTNPLARANHTGTQLASTISNFDTQVQVSANPGFIANVNDYMQFVGQGANSFLTADQRECMMPFWIGQTITVDQLGCWVNTTGTAGSVTRMGLRNTTGARPGTLLVDGGTVATGPAVTGLVTVSVSQVLTPGLYWFDICTQGAPATNPKLQVAASWDILPGISSTFTQAQPAVGTFLSGVAGALGAGAPSVGTNVLTTANGWWFTMRRSA